MSDVRIMLVKLQEALLHGDVASAKIYAESLAKQKVDIRKPSTVETKLKEIRCAVQIYTTQQKFEVSGRGLVYLLTNFL